MSELKLNQAMNLDSIENIDQIGDFEAESINGGLLLENKVRSKYISRKHLRMGIDFKVHDHAQSKSHSLYIAGKDDQDFMSLNVTEGTLEYDSNLAEVGFQGKKIDYKSTDKITFVRDDYWASTIKAIKE